MYLRNPRRLEKCLATEVGEYSTCPAVYVKKSSSFSGFNSLRSYLSFTDAHPDAVNGFADEVKDHALDVDLSEKWGNCFDDDKRKALIEILAQDPRPGYQHDPERIYGFEFCGFDVRYRVVGDQLTVVEIQ